MAEIITMPRLSDTMTEGVVAQWLKKVGDKIAEGDILAEIETDKATMEFESFNEGTLLYIGLKDGESAPVDSLLAIIGEKGEDVEALVKEFNKTHKASKKIAIAKEEKTVVEKTSTKEVITETPTPVEAISEQTLTGERVIASPLAKK